METKPQLRTSQAMGLPLTIHLYRNGGKRLLDFVLSLSALLLLSPIACCVFILIAFGLGIPATFCQRRLGLRGQSFLLHKFRSMTDERDSQGQLLSDEKRRTKLGKIVRSTSLDELPQLFDILRGEMSLVGPRPLLLSYRDRYTQREWRRHEVKPGLTGWAAVNGRNSVSWEEKLELDVYYIENYSLSFDLKILWLTVAKVLKRSGVSGAEAATCEIFRPDGLEGNPMT